MCPICKGALTFAQCPLIDMLLQKLFLFHPRRNLGIYLVHENCLNRKQVLYYQNNAMNYAILIQFHTFQKFNKDVCTHPVFMFLFKPNWVVDGLQQRLRKQKVEMWACYNCIMHKSKSKNFVCAKGNSGS